MSSFKKASEVCPEPSSLWFWIAIILIIVMLAMGGYFGYKILWADTLCFRDDTTKQCAKKVE